MNLPDMNSKNFAKLKFAGFFGGAVVLCIIILSSFWTSGSSTPPQELDELKSLGVTGAARILEINQLLHSRWIQLEQLYDTKALSAADPSKTELSELTSKQIKEAETAYAKILDSVATNNATLPSVDKVDSVVNTYKASLQNKQALNNNINELVSRNNGAAPAANTTSVKVDDAKLTNLQRELVAKTELIAKLQTEAASAVATKGSLTTNEQKIRQLQADLQTKAEAMANLEAKLKAAPVKNNPVVDDKKLKELQKELQSKTAMINKLQSQVKDAPVKASTASPDVKKMTDELEFLKWALRSEVSSNHALTADINKLKATNATLNNQLKGK